MWQTPKFCMAMWTLKGNTAEATLNNFWRFRTRHKSLKKEDPNQIRDLLKQVSWTLVQSKLSAKLKSQSVLQQILLTIKFVVKCGNFRQTCMSYLHCRVTGASWKRTFLSIFFPGSLWCLTVHQKKWHNPSCLNACIIQWQHSDSIHRYSLVVVLSDPTKDNVTDMSNSSVSVSTLSYFRPLVNAKINMRLTIINF